MTEYILFILSIFFLLLIKTENKKIKYRNQLIALLVIVLFAVLRFDVGFDYKTYYGFVQKNEFEGFERFEPLNKLIFYIAIYLNSPFVLFAIFGLLVYLIMFFSFKNLSKSLSFSIIIYISLFYLFSLGALRQAVAMSVCLYAYKYLSRRNLGKFLLTIGVASMFHYSAIISVIIYFIYKIKIRYVVLGGVLLLICKQILFYYIMTYTVYGAYITEVDEFSGGRFKQAFFVLLAFSVLFFIRYRKVGIEEKRLLSIVIAGSIFPFLFGTAVGDRIALYFYIYYCYLLPALFPCPKYNRISISYSVIFISYFIFYVFYTSVVNDVAPYVPYRMILNNSFDDFRY